jgi:autotransporter-associated beta strand repeat
MSSFQPSRTQSAQWDLDPISGDWNTAANWTPATVPNGPADTATFALSNTTDVSISADTEVNGIMFTPAATNPYFITIDFEPTLTLNGTGITNNSGIEQRLEVDGLLQFSNSSTAGSASILNLGGTSFFNTSTAGSANIFTLGVVSFLDSSTAGSANIFTDEIGLTFFGNTSTAGNATVGGDGFLVFDESSQGGTARVVLTDHGGGAIGVLDISGHNAPGVTIGSIEGDANNLVLLGANNLTVGSNNLSTTFSGIIRDGSLGGGGTGGSLTKIGSGTLILSGANIYTGNTNINGGVLQVDGSISSNTFVNHRGTLAGTGTINGNVTNNGRVSPGALAVPGVLTVVHNYTQAQFATLMIQIAGLNTGDFSVLNVWETLI